jgi:GR25 family glycosyltransferase involved in LPS biosynthesis
MTTPPKKFHDFVVFQNAPLFVINLPRRADRRKIAEEEVQHTQSLSNSVPQWVAAVDGKELKNLHTDSDLSYRARRDITRIRSAHEGLHTPGAVACYKSHRKVWKHIIDNKIPYAKIFEDDFRVRKQVVQKMKCTIDNLPQNFDVLLLCDLLVPELQPTSIAGNSDILKVNGFFMFLTGYYLTFEGAKILYDLSFPAEVQVDIYMSLLAAEKKISVYCMKHPLLYQPIEPWNSDIQTLCFKCFLPGESEFYIGSIFVVIFLLCALLAVISAFTKYREKAQLGQQCNTSMCKLLLGSGNSNKSQSGTTSSYLTPKM